jgi:hypothetical protein
MCGLSGTVCECEGPQWCDAVGELFECVGIAVEKRSSEGGKTDTTACTVASERPQR